MERAMSGLGGFGVLVDVGRLSELAYVRDGGDHLAIGALTRHCDLEGDALAREHAAVLSYVAAQVGDPVVASGCTFSRPETNTSAVIPGRRPGRPSAIVTLVV